MTLGFYIVNFRNSYLPGCQPKTFGTLGKKLDVLKFLTQKESL